MFGDTLSAAECGALVQALGRTALAFACAHGRPTSLPLLDLGQWREGRARARELELHEIHVPVQTQALIERLKGFL